MEQIMNWYKSFAKRDDIYFKIFVTAIAAIPFALSIIMIWRFDGIQNTIQP